MFGLAKTETDVVKRVNRLYEAASRTAERYHYAFRRKETSPNGLPTVLLLGNHSSGKSTIVNDLIGEPPVQDTGVAPTDDSFTILLYGDEDRDFFGPAAIGQIPVDFVPLKELGQDFLAHLVVRFRRRDFLKKVQLVDSPGMIDTASGTATRNYDFTRAVKTFSEISDLVMFLFDPEKPGTTGETVDVLSSCLRGIEFKLRVLLNKADTFDSMEDYARAYGTLCWNLARVLRTKDLPQIYSTFTPSPAARLAARVPLDHFERNRGKILELLGNVGTRRLDSVLASAMGDFSRLSIQSRVLGAVRRRLFAAGSAGAAATLLATAVASFCGWFKLVRPLAENASRVSTVFAWSGAVAAGLVVFASLAYLTTLRQRALRRRLASDKALDSIFGEIFARRAAVSGIQDIAPWWNEIRSAVSEIVRAGNSLPLFSWGDFARIDRIVTDELPELASAPRAASNS